MWGERAMSRAGLLNVGIVDIWASNSSLWGAFSLCTVGYLAALLASNHYMPGVTPTSPSLDKRKCPLTLPNVSCGKPNFSWLKTIRQTQLFPLPSALRVWTRYFRGKWVGTQLRTCLVDVGNMRGNQRQGLRPRTQVSGDCTRKRKRPEGGE